MDVGLPISGPAHRVILERHLAGLQPDGPQLTGAGCPGGFVWA